MIEVRPLRPEDDRTGFRCGDPDLDRFFQRFAGQNQFRHRIGTTWVALESGAIQGFATVTMAQIEAADLPDTLRAGLPRHALPALRLARLAVAEAARGRGIGQVLIRLVFTLAHETADRLGCVGVLVDAKAQAVDFYTKLGFHPLRALSGELADRPRPLPMFLSLGSIPRV